MPCRAHLFINYLMKPEVIAEITNFVGSANANLGATPLLDPVIANDTASYPTLDTMARPAQVVRRSWKIGEKRSASVIVGCARGVLPIATFPP
jgi:spermidine/putrescine-binding protein